MVVQLFCHCFFTGLFGTEFNDFLLLYVYLFLEGLDFVGIFIECIVDFFYFCGGCIAFFFGFGAALLMSCLVLGKVLELKKLNVQLIIELVFVEFSVL